MRAHTRPDATTPRAQPPAREPPPRSDRPLGPADARGQRRGPGTCRPDAPGPQDASLRGGAAAPPASGAERSGGGARGPEARPCRLRPAAPSPLFSRRVRRNPRAPESRPAALPGAPSHAMLVLRSRLAAALAARTLAPQVPAAETSPGRAPGAGRQVAAGTEGRACGRPWKEGVRIAARAGGRGAGRAGAASQGRVPTGLGASIRGTHVGFQLFLGN